MIELKVLKRDPQDNNEYLRSQGLVPAILYGSDFESTPVSVDDIEFRKVYKEAGTSHLITSTGEVSGEMLIVQDMQVHVVSGELLHIDFKVVEKGQKTEITVPIVLIGKAPAKENKIGLLNFSNEEVVIETIPSNIPESIEVDITGLANLGDSIKISDIKLPEGVELVDDEDFTIVSIVSPREEEPEEEAETDTVMEPELVDQKGKEEATEESTEAE